MALEMVSSSRTLLEQYGVLLALACFSLLPIAQQSLEILVTKQWLNCAFQPRSASGVVTSAPGLAPVGEASTQPADRHTSPSACIPARLVFGGGECCRVLAEGRRALCQPTTVIGLEAKSMVIGRGFGGGSTVQASQRQHASASCCGLGGHCKAKRLYAALIASMDASGLSPKTAYKSLKLPATGVALALPVYRPRALHSEHLFPSREGIRPSPRETCAGGRLPSRTDLWLPSLPTKIRAYWQQQ